MSKYLINQHETISELIQLVRITFKKHKFDYLNIDHNIALCQSLINELDCAHECYYDIMEPFYKAAITIDKYNSKVAPIVHATNWVNLFFTNDLKSNIDGYLEQINKSIKQNYSYDDFNETIRLLDLIYTNISQIHLKRDIFNLGLNKLIALKTSTMQPYIDRKYWLKLLV